jgi:regulator of sigma E protease
VSSFFFFILLLSILVVAHELGHYWIARWLGVRVLRFSVGFGPEIFGYTKGGTRYSFSAIPFGGYVKFAGDTPEEFEAQESEAATTERAPDEFLAKSVPVRAAIVLGGPLMNYLLAIVVYAGVLWLVGEETINTTRIGEVENGTTASAMGFQPDDVVKSVNGKQIEDWEGFGREISKVGAASEFQIEVDRGGQALTLSGRAPAEAGFDESPLGVGPYTEPVIGYVKHDGPAYQGGLRKGDRMLSIDGAEIDRWSAMRDKIRESPGREITLRWIRDGAEREGKITPTPTPAGEGAAADTVGQIGIQQAVETRRVGPIAALAGGAERVWWITEQVVKFLPSIPVSLYRAIVKGESIEGLGGPVRMAQLSGEAARWGVDAFFNFLALISTQLAIFNLLPIPVLDGGHLALYGVEALLRRPPSLRVRLILHQIGFALLVLLLLSVTVMDVGRLFG